MKNCLRLLLVSSSHDHPEAPCYFKYLVKPLFLSKIYEDISRLEAFLKSYRGPVKVTNLRPFKLVDGRRSGKEKTALAYSAESTGWEFDTHMDYMAEVMLRCWERREFENQMVDLGNYD